MQEEPLLGAIEAGGTKCIVAVSRADGTIIARERIPTTTPEKTMPRLVGFLREEAASAGGRLTGIGVASFGPLNLDPASSGHGSITTTPKPGWVGCSWPRSLEPLAAPVAVDTDVNAAALGEYRSGAGMGCATVAYTTVGTGIGTGVIHNGVPLAGFSHFESGHIRVPRIQGDAFPGACPWHGDCLEGLASGPALAARLGGPLEEAGNQRVAIELSAGYLAFMAAHLVLLHTPHRLIFGGGVMKAPGLLAALRRKTERLLGGYVTSPWLDLGLERYIVAPELHDDAGITGAIALAQQASSAA